MRKVLRLVTAASFLTALSSSLAVAADVPIRYDVDLVSSKVNLTANTPLTFLFFTDSDCTQPLGNPQEERTLSPVDGGIDQVMLKSKRPAIYTYRDLVVN